MRRRLKSASEDPITIPPRDKALSLESDQPYDIRNVKRVRFSDKGLDSFPDHAAPGRKHEQFSHQDVADVPKTSEYAYFRNIKSCGVPVRPGSLHKKNQHSKSSKTHYLNKESNDASDIHKPKSKGFEFSVSEERIRPKQHSLFSPRVNVTCDAKQRSPLLSQDLKPRGQHLPSLPLNKALEISDLKCNTKQRSSLLSQNLTSGRQHFKSSPLNETFEISGNQCSKKGIFSEKRDRLRQWVIRTSSPEVQNFHLNGSDLVAALLNRLCPKSEESYGSSTKHSDNSKSLLVHESKDLEKEPQLPHTRNRDENLPIIRYGNSNEIVPSEWISLHKSGSGNLTEHRIVEFDRLKSRQSSSHKQLDFSFCLPIERHESSSSYHLKEVEEFCSAVEHAREEPQLPRTRNWDEYLPIIRYGNSNEIVPSGWISLHKSGSGNLTEYEIVELDRLKSRQSSSHKQLDFSFCLPIEKHESSSSHRLKEVEEFCSAVEHAREEAHNSLLLDCGPKRQKTGVYSSSIVNPNNTESLFPSLATSWHDDYQKMVDLEIEWKASLCSSLEFNSMPNYKSPSCLIENFEPDFEHVKYSVVEPDKFALTLPYTTKGTSLEDNRNAENTLHNIENMISYRDKHWLKNKVWDGKQEYDSWKKDLYGTYISEEEDTPSVFCSWRFPSAEQYPFSGNSFDNYFSSSNYQERFQASRQFYKPAFVTR